MVKKLFKVFNENDVNFTSNNTFYSPIMLIEYADISNNHLNIYKYVVWQYFYDIVM